MDEIVDRASDAQLAELTAEVVAAYVGRNAVPAAELPGLIAAVHAAFGRAAAGAAGDTTTTSSEKPKPAVPVKKSVTDDHIVCLEDGKAFKSLKRHLMTHYNLTPDEYRAKWDLPPDYPMVAPSYAAARSRLAREMGLGSKRKAGRSGEGA